MSKPANPKQAYGDKKVPLQLVPPALEIGAARALGEGAAKYGAYNWRETQVECMTYIGAIKRHLAAYQDGEDVDPESTVGKLHLEGIAACVAIMLDSQAMGSLIDNRPPKGPAPALVLTPKNETRTPLIDRLNKGVIGLYEKSFQRATTATLHPEDLLALMKEAGALKYRVGEQAEIATPVGMVMLLPSAQVQRGIFYVGFEQ